jgi:hypothetical protein
VTASEYHAPAGAPASKTAPRRSSRLTEREKLEGRLHAAKVNGGAAAATPRGDGRFTVVGRAGDRYTVQVFDLETMTCDCKAGQFGTACWHAAATYLRIIADRTAA